MRRTFTWGSHDEMGDGFIPDFFPGAWPTGGGLGAAHDMLEHPLGDGGCENELMALGACWYGRGEQGHLGNSYRTAEETMGANIEGCWREVLHGAQTLRDGGRTKPTQWNTTEEAFEAMLQDAKSLFIAEEGYAGYDPLDGLPADFMERTRSWLRRGYRWAACKYRDPDRLTDMFGRIQKEFDSVCRQGDVGEQIVVTCNVAKGSLAVRHRYLDLLDQS